MDVSTFIDSSILLFISGNGDDFGRCNGLLADTNIQDAVEQRGADAVQIVSLFPNRKTFLHDDGVAEPVQPLSVNTEDGPSGALIFHANLDIADAEARNVHGNRHFVSRVFAVDVDVLMMGFVLAGTTMFVVVGGSW